MAKEIFIELRSALYPPENISISVNRGEERVDQIYSGIKSFVEHFKTIPQKDQCDVFFVDNTLDDLSKLPEKIGRVLFENKIKVLLCNQNYYGSKNKGAGDIDIWKKNFKIISDYKWFLHFEPRTILNSPDFIRECLDYPCNTFKVLSGNKSNDHFYTGLFMINTNDLGMYINSIDLDEMVKESISIEYSLMDFIVSVSNQFKDYKKKLSVKWHDAHEDRFIEF